MAVIQPSHEYGSIAHKVWPWSMTRGGLAVIFGILGFALLLPMGTMHSFAMVIGIFAILDGVANGVEAARWRGGAMVLRGIAGLVGVVFGVWSLLMMGGMQVSQMIWMTAIWAFVIGGLEVVVNIIERSSEHRDWMFGMIMGGFGLALGVVSVIAMPLLTTLIWFAAVAIILWGIAGLIMGAGERRLSHTN